MLYMEVHGDWVSLKSSGSKDDSVDGSIVDAAWSRQQSALEWSPNQFRER